jgi:hypothetical protein
MIFIMRFINTLEEAGPHLHSLNLFHLVLDVRRLERRPGFPYDLNSRYRPKDTGYNVSKTMSWTTQILDGLYHPEKQ